VGLDETAHSLGGGQGRQTNQGVCVAQHQAPSQGMIAATVSGQQSTI
jgi:hypothetical protein